MRLAFPSVLVRCVLSLFLGLAAWPVLAQDKACAVVVIHGKWGSPQFISFFGRKLGPDCQFKSIEMPWSLRRSYDQPYPAALRDIAAQVKVFRDEGYKRVFLAGHSFGANAVLAYMAEVGNVDGVIALAPGHSPRNMYERGLSKESVDKARELAAAGKGAESLTIEDLNMGKRQSIRMSADVMLSYFEPQGLGDMLTSASRFRQPVPLLWVYGSADPLYKVLGTTVYDKAPAHPASKYLVVSADHLTTPDVAVPEVLAWIKTLP